MKDSYECILPFTNFYVRILLPQGSWGDTVSHLIKALHKNNSILRADDIRNLNQGGSVRFFNSVMREGVSFDESSQTITVYGLQNDFHQGISLYYIANYYAECVYATTYGMLFVHAAAIYSPFTNKSYLILGEKGAGKTSLIIYLCREYGMELIGNDRVVVSADNKNGTILLHGGTSWVDVRETAIHSSKYLRTLNIIFPSQNDSPMWNNKVRLTCDDLSIRHHTGVTEIDSIYHINVDQCQKKIFSGYWRGLQESLLLHEKFGRSITGQTTPFLSDSGQYLGSLPTLNLLESVQTRDKIVKSIIAKGVKEIFASTIEDIALCMNEVFTNAPDRNPYV